MKLSFSKRIGLGTVLLAYFLVGYYLIAYMHDSGLRIDTWIDKAIPFVPAFIVFYSLGYVFVFLPMFIINDKKEFYRLFWTYFAVLTISFAMFYALPVEQEVSVTYGNDIFSKLIEFQHNHDPRFNNFPSLHISLNFLSYLILFRKSRRWGVNGSFMILPIILSVLFTKEHLFLDVIGGLVLGAAAFLSYTMAIRHIHKL